MLCDHVLVLNNHYSAINVCTVKRALNMLFQNRAEVVTVENGMYCTYDIASWSELSSLKRELGVFNDDEELMGSIIVPRVIRTVYFSKVPTRKVRLNRKNIYLRDGNTCQYCGKVFASEDLNLDHVLPRAQGGISSWTNLVCSCYKCNNKKGSKTPEEAKMKLIRKPYEPKNTTMFNVNFFDQGSHKYDSWKNFLSEVYWNIELKP